MKKEVKELNLPSSRGFDKDIAQFQLLYAKLHKKYGLSVNDLIKQVEEDIFIPISIFSEKLSGLEIICKYLKENLGFEIKKISQLLNRSEKTIWQAYNFSKKKSPELFRVGEESYTVPVSIFKDRRLGVLECIVKYLKDKFGLKYSEIAVLLHRDQRTVWTAYSRAIKKGGRHEN